MLDGKYREQLVLSVAQANSCEYCLSAHSAIGKMVGLKPEEIEASRKSQAAEAKRDAGLKFAHNVVIARGEVWNEDVERVREAGVSDGEITEIVAHVALKIFKRN